MNEYRADRRDVETGATSIAEMLRGYSIEVNPNDSNIVAAAAGRLDPGTEVFLPWIPGSDPVEIVRTAARLRRVGLFPVPHVCARQLESVAQLEQLCAQLAGYAGFDRILLIGGDRAKPLGPFESSLAVMQTDVFPRAGIKRIAVAGFPEGNPNISESALDEVLLTKVALARRSGLQLSIVTQFCFEAQPILEWLRHIRARGIDVPVRVGLAGPASLMTLARYAVRCGIGNSARVLTERPSFAKLLIEKGPEHLVRELAGSAGSAMTSLLRCGIDGLHFFVFGGLDRTVDWINAVRGPSLAPSHA